MFTKAYCWAFTFLISVVPNPLVDETITKWENEIKHLESLQATEKTDSGIVFYGSSSIRRWDSIQEDMSPWATIQRGYGGAKLNDIVHFAPRILGPHLGVNNPQRCRGIVLFVANDITGNKESDLAAAQVAEKFEQLLRWIRSKDNAIPVFWIEVTPTALRWEAWDQINNATEQIRHVLDRDPSAYLIPTAGAFLGNDGQPVADYFVADKLHLNATGYKLWSALVKTQLHLRLGPATAAKK